MTEAPEKQCTMAIDKNTSPARLMVVKCQNLRVSETSGGSFGVWQEEIEEAWESSTS